MLIRRGLLAAISAVRKVLHSITSATGIASLTTNLTDPVENLTVNFSPVQSGTGDPSPSNVRPISGWTGVTVNHAFGDFYSSAGTVRYNTYTTVTILSENSIRVQGQNSSGSKYPASKQDLSAYQLVNGKTYFVESDVTYTSGKGQITIRDSANDTVAESEYITASGHYSLMFVYNSSTMKTLSLFANRGAIGGDVTYANIQFMEVDSIQVDWTSEVGTVYGGSLNVTSGVLTVLRGFIDLGTLTYSRSSIVSNGFVGVSPFPDDFPVAPSTSTVPDWICSQYSVKSNRALDSASTDRAIAFRVSGSNKGVIIKDSGYSSYYTDNDMASFKIAMNGVQLVYMRTTPATYQLTPHQVSTIIDQNTIWHDMNGAISLDYYDLQ